MQELATYQQCGLPDKPQDLVKFVLFAQEKAKSLRAEIRAIEKLELANEVYEQKLEEQARLRELILVASQKIGEFTKTLPKSEGGRPAVETLPARGQSLNMPKSEVLKEMGLSTSQVQRFETMAAHPDIVETVVAESKAGLADATQGEVLRRISGQTNVIDMAKARKDLFDRDMSQIDADAKIAKAFTRAVFAPLTIADTADEIAAAVWRNVSGNVQDDLTEIDDAIAMLSAIKNKLMNGGRLYGRQ